ncbi:hypothetical protein Q7P36_004645 [Cladosporium allicinum]
MKTSTVLSTAVLIAGTTIQPAHASVGGGAGLIGDLIKKVLQLIIGDGNQVKRGLHFGGPEHPNLAARQSFPGVPDFEYQRCSEDISGATVTVNMDGTNIQFSGVPATCMNLANVLIGEPGEGPYALPCGSDCLRYSDLSADQYGQLMAALGI